MVIFRYLFTSINAGKLINDNNKNQNKTGRLSRHSSANPAVFVSHDPFTRHNIILPVQWS